MTDGKTHYEILQYMNDKLQEDKTEEERLKFVKEASLHIIDKKFNKNIVSRARTK